jgi:hypothetical protein
LHSPPFERPQRRSPPWRGAVAAAPMSAAMAEPLPLDPFAAGIVAPLEPDEAPARPGNGLTIVAESLRLILIDDDSAQRAHADWERAVAAAGAPPPIAAFAPLESLVQHPGVCVLHQARDDYFNLRVLVAGGEMAGLGRADEGHLRLDRFGDPAVARQIATEYVGCLNSGRAALQYVTVRAAGGERCYRRLLLPLRWRERRADMLVSLAWPPVSLAALVARPRAGFGRRAA